MAQLPRSAARLPLTLVRAGDPENTALGSVAPEAAKNPLLRYGSEVALDVAGAGPFEGAGGALRAAGRGVGFVPPRVPADVAGEYPELALGRKRTPQLFATSENPQFPKALEVAEDDYDTAAGKLLGELQERVDPAATRTPAQRVFAGGVEPSNDFRVRPATVIQRKELTAIRQAHVDENGQASDLLLWPTTRLNPRAQPVGIFVLDRAPGTEDFIGLRRLVQEAADRRAAG